MRKSSSSSVRNPVRKRIYLSSLGGRDYKVLIKDNAAEQVIFRIEAPSYRAGNAIVRSLRQVEMQYGTIW